MKKFIGQDLEYHSYVELKLENRWIILDTSFDVGLKNVFPVNEWDIKGTKLAVIPEKIFDTGDSQYIISRERLPIKVEKIIKLNSRLYNRLNKLYSEIRKQK